jgi:hypothetical protein
MAVKDMTDDALWAGMADALEGMTNITKYQKTLAAGQGLPKDHDTRVQLMVANLHLMENLREQYDGCFAELQHRYSR